MIGACRPWMRIHADRLLASGDRLPHALLLAGAPGLGKSAFAQWLATRLLCDAPGADGACGSCRQCQLMAAGTHPDLHVVMPDSHCQDMDSPIARLAVRYLPSDKGRESKASNVIKIDQIRELMAAIVSRPQIATRRSVLVDPADVMNSSAANAFLKLLEEPPADTHLILVSSRPMRLPATVRSRCVRVSVRVPAPDQAVAWLVGQGLPVSTAGELVALAGGSPGLALKLHGDRFLETRAELMNELEGMLAGRVDPVSCAGRWRERGGDQCLTWLQGWLADLATLGRREARNLGLMPRLQVLKKRLDLKDLFEVGDAVGRARSRLGGVLDEQLVLEDTLIRWTQLGQKSR